MPSTSAEEQTLNAGMEELTGTVTSTEAIFETFDKDQSGSLDLEELREAAKAAGRPADDDAVRETLTALDTDKDGTVSLEEFKAAPRELAWWEKSGSY